MSFFITFYLAYVCMSICNVVKKLIYISSFFLSRTSSFQQKCHKASLNRGGENKAPCSFIRGLGSLIIIKKLDDLFNCLVFLKPCILTLQLYMEVYCFLTRSVSHLLIFKKIHLLIRQMPYYKPSWSKNLARFKISTRFEWVHKLF